jgi:hypothetical protein
MAARIEAGVVPPARDNWLMWLLQRLGLRGFYRVGLWWGGGRHRRRQILHDGRGAGHAGETDGVRKVLVVRDEQSVGGGKFCFRRRVENKGARPEKRGGKLMTILFGCDWN